MISEAGFVWLRQEFPWEDIEVDGRGQFTDSRNDFDGDGERIRLIHGINTTKLSI